MAWFVALWSAGVITLLVVTYIIRLVVAP